MLRRVVVRVAQIGQGIANARPVAEGRNQMVDGLKWRCTHKYARRRRISSTVASWGALAGERGRVDYEVVVATSYASAVSNSWEDDEQRKETTGVYVLVDDDDDDTLQCGPRRRSVEEVSVRRVLAGDRREPAALVEIREGRQGLVRDEAGMGVYGGVGAGRVRGDQRGVVDEERAGVHRVRFGAPRAAHLGVLRLHRSGHDEVLG